MLHQLSRRSFFLPRGSTKTKKIENVEVGRVKQRYRQAFLSPFFPPLVKRR